MTPNIYVSIVAALKSESFHVSVMSLVSLGFCRVRKNVTAHC